jgi:CRP-like cAMP-binding protein
MVGPNNPQQNRLLAALSPTERARVYPDLRLVQMARGKVLYTSGDVLRDVYFPADCIVSQLHMMENGASAEISSVGNDGAIGVAPFLGGATSMSSAIVQSAGCAYVLTSERLKQEFDRHGEMLHILLRYMQVLLAQMAHAAVCYQHHPVEQRLSRWLLLSLDRLDSNRLTTTHEVIANMLGVRREGVTAAIGKLQKIGVIAHSRMQITVLDRHKLEQLCCECYAAVRKETDRLLPLPYVELRRWARDTGPVRFRWELSDRKPALLGAADAR